MRPWIGIDLDGTLAHHESGDGVDTIGAPVPLMVKRVKAWLKGGMNVRIMTARVSVAEPHEADLERTHVAARLQRRMIESWCLTHIGRVLPVTCSKDYAMLELWDDRAVAVERNTGLFKSWETT